MLGPNPHATEALLEPSPLISVLLPICNAQATLPTAIASLLRQRETRWECVAVDDGSTDASATILRHFAHREPRMRVLSVPHAGLVSALNLGLAACRGEFVARMDADDIMHSDRLSAQLALLQGDPALAGSGCHVRLFPRTALAEGRLEYERWLNSLRDAHDVARDAFIECPLAHPTWFMRRRILCEEGYRDLGWPEDYDGILRMLGAGLTLGVVPRRLLLWRDSPTRLSRQSSTYALERFVACKAHHLARSFLRNGSTYVLWGYGSTGRSLARALEGEGRRVSHLIEVHPRRLGQRIRGVCVLPPDALASLRGEPIVVSVAGRGPRADVRAKTRELGLREGLDFVCAA